MASATEATTTIDAATSKMEKATLNEYDLCRSVHESICSHHIHLSAPIASVPKTSAPPEQHIVTPWDVQGQIAEDGRQLAINYDALIEQFGTRRVDDALLERFEKLTGAKPHPLLRRGMFFSHRYVQIFNFDSQDLIDLLIFQ
jgi:hypothetical protein